MEDMKEELLCFLIKTLKRYIFLYSTVKKDEYVLEEIKRIWSPDLNVSVTLCDGFASISHCWFDNWKGLVQMKWEIQYNIQEKQITEIKKVDEKVLVEYHCGIRY